MSDDGKTPQPKPERPAAQPLIRPPKQSLFSNLRSSFLAGIVVVAPIGITVAIVYWFVTGPMAQLDTFVKRAIPDSGSTLEAITRAIPGFGVMVAILAIVLLGAFAKNFIGRAFIKAGEELFEAVPIVRTLYKFFRNVFETALQQSERSFKEVALIEYPLQGTWVMAFVIGNSKGEIRSVLSDKFDDPVSVFVPTVPNPTSGFLLFVPRSKMKPLTMSVEDAAKTVFSLGLVVPEFHDPKEAVKRLQELANSLPEESKRTRRPLFRVRGE